MLIIIYVGAIAILFLFVIMMLDILQLSKITRIYHIFPLLGLTLMQLFFSNINFLGYVSNPQSILVWDFDYKSQIHILGATLYSDYAVPFIIISILLLIAMIGVIVLTLESNLTTKRQYLIDQHQRNNSWT
jgi:NADH:ubiquinone oxidoreductase subunit 6 (subunit J)